MKSKVLILLACLFAISADLPAQSVGSKLKDKVLNKMKQKGEEKTDQAIDSAIDKPVDKTEEKVKESVKNSGEEESSGNTEQDGSGHQPPAGQDAQMQQWMEMMGGGIKLEDYPDMDQIQPSKFKGSFDMEMESWKNGKMKDDGTISWYIREYDVAMIPDMETSGKKQESRIIIQRRKGIMIMLTNDKGEKNGMVMKMKTISVDLSETESGEQLENMTVQVMKNNRRTINGYDCYKVVAYDESFESESWITEDLPLDMRNLFGFMGVQNRDSNPYEEKYGHIRGMVIESTSTDKNSGDKDVMRMINIKSGNPDDAMFSTDGYNLMQMPDMGGFGQ